MWKTDCALMLRCCAFQCENKHVRKLQCVHVSRLGRKRISITKL